MHPADHVSLEEELARYRQHNNSVDEAGYVAFLTRFSDRVRAHLPLGSRGLDFGCGPAPVLGGILSAANYPTVSYDPHFLPDQRVLDSKFDFVTCCEVVEHAFVPAALFLQLGTYVRDGGTIAVMTQLYDEVRDFSAWWYVRDVTHVSFFCMDTMRWVARRFGWALAQPADNIVLFTTGRP